MCGSSRSRSSIHPFSALAPPAGWESGSQDCWDLPGPSQGTTWTNSVTSRDKTTVCAHTDSLSFRKVGGRQRPPNAEGFPRPGDRRCSTPASLCRVCHSFREIFDAKQRGGPFVRRRTQFKHALKGRTQRQELQMKYSSKNMLNFRVFIQGEKKKSLNSRRRRRRRLLVMFAQSTRTLSSSAVLQNKSNRAFLRGSGGS